MDSDFEINFSETNYTHHWKNMFKKVNDQIFQKLATRSKIGFMVMVKINLRVSSYLPLTNAEMYHSNVLLWIISTV